MPSRKPLTMFAVSYSSGIPNHYRILGLPEGETADLVFKIKGAVEKWKIRRNDEGAFNGAYKNADEALVALQAQVDAESHQGNQGPPQ
jgi:hypothetical protein